MNDDVKRTMLKAARIQELQLAGIVGLVIVMTATCSAIVSHSLSRLDLDMGSGVALALASLNLCLPILVLWGLQNWLPPFFERRQLQKIIRGEISFGRLPAHAYAHVGLGGILLSTMVHFVSFVLTLAIGGRWLAQLLLLLAGSTLMLFSFAYHRVPNSRRSVKYMALFAGSGLIGTLFRLGQVRSSGIIVNEMVFWVFVDIPATIAALIFIRNSISPESALEAGAPTTRNAFKWHRWVMKYGPRPGLATLGFMLLRAIPFVGSLYWAARMYSREKLAKAPVLFLRSFAHDAADKLVADVVSPAISSVAVLVALVHPSQTAAQLNRKTHEGWIPLTLSIGNEQWQTWFAEQLATATAVVVDATVLTPSTQWELQTAMKRLGRDRVAVLTKAGTGGDLHLQGYLVYEYPPDKPAAIRPVLAQWIDFVIASTYDRPPAIAAAS